jgi:putative membrane protein
MQDKTQFIKNFIGSFLGVVGISAVIAFPTVGQANINSNQSILAQNTPGKVSPTPGSTNRTGDQASLDQKFVTQAGESDLFEIQTSQLALQRAKSPEVKKFAQQMINEHTNSSKQLSSIAQQKGYKLPTTMGQANASLLTQLTKAADANFDNTYMQLQVTAHTKTLDNYRNYINNASDSQLKAFATKTVSVVDKHLKMAQSMVGNSGDSGSSSGTSPRGTIPGSNRPTTNTPGTGTVRPSPDTGR